MKVSVTFGGLADPINVQLAAQSLRISDQEAEIRAQRFADSILFLSIQGVLSDSEKARARKRVIKYIAQRAEVVK